MAGKLHALLQRTYVKGRDLYDMIWYLSDPLWPSPNLTLLNNALEQTQWSGPRITPQNWQDITRERITELDWSKVATDLAPFLEDQWEINLINQDTFLRLLNK